MKLYTLLAHLFPIPLAYYLITQEYSYTWLVAGCIFSLLLAIYGFSIGMHHTFSHPTFSFPRSIEVGLAFVSFYAMLQSPMTWSTVHKAHHRYADREGDPHSPSVLGWRVWFPWNYKLGAERPYRRILQDPVHRFIHRNEWLLLLHPLLAAAFGMNAFVFFYLLPVSYIIILQLIFVGLSHGKVENDQGNKSQKSLLLYFFALTDGDHEKHHKDLSCPESHRFFANLIGNRNVRKAHG